jgi:hypothetical protein
VTKILARLIFYYLVLVSEYLIFMHPWGTAAHKPVAVVDGPEWPASPDGEPPSAFRMALKSEVTKDTADARRPVT